MESEIYYKKKKIDTICELIMSYGADEFKSPFRSTIPLLILYKVQPTNCFGLIDHSSESNAKYIFEFETPVIKGKGSPSCTDLMIEYPNVCIAIEAKRTEQAYETVISWLGDSDNRKLVLDGWIEIISNYTDIKFDSKSISDLPYQLIHRVASACSLNKSQTHVVYLGFDLDKTKTKYYRDSLTKFSKILGNKIDFHLACSKIDKLVEQTKLELMWDSGERNLSEYVVQGLMNDSLMKVSQITIEKINKST